MKAHYNDDILRRYLDNDLPDSLAREVKGHVEACGDCEKNLNAIRVLKAMVQAVPEVELSDGFDFELERQLDEIEAAGFEREKEREKVFVFRMPAVPALARAVVMLLLLVSAVFTGIYYTVPGRPVISGISGTAFIMDKKTGNWNDLNEGAVINKGDMIKAGSDSEIDISLSAKYHVRLKENTTLQVAKLTPAYRKGSFRANLRQGNILIDVDKRFKGSTFDVNTDIADVRALGTKFMISLGEATGGTWVGVLQGEVAVVSKQELPAFPDAVQEVLVPSGMKAEVLPGVPLKEPVPLLQTEWRQLSELYMMGQKTTVALLIGSGKDRVIELLSPCAIFISDEKPRVIPKDISKAIDTIALAIEREDPTLHLEGISILEKVVKKNPEADYNVQLLLFIGSYYNYVDSYNDAIETFNTIIKKYPRSPLASLAACAIGYIYQEYLQDDAEAKEAYARVINNYPYSPEAEFAKERLSQM